MIKGTKSAWIGIDPGGSPGFAVLEEVNGEPCLVGTNTWKDWGPSNNWQPMEMWSHRPWPPIFDGEDKWVQILYGCPTFVFERQWAWGIKVRADADTKLIMAYSLLQPMLIEMDGTDWSRRIFSPSAREWQTFFKKEVGEPPPGGNFEKLVICYYLGECPRMSEHERSAVCLALWGYLNHGKSA